MAAAQLLRRYNPRMPSLPPPLGGLSPSAFLRGYWQKRPLLVRQAIPGFDGLLGKRELFGLASGHGVDSRLIRSTRSAWHVSHGPFASRTFKALPAKDWTLLVNGLNLHCPAADALLQRFSFASWARLDDVMVSFAVDRGGVGPHVDSYDVFLLQGPGRRRWRLMPPARRPFRLVDPAPIRLIADFRPTQEMVLDPGDMLYLPPGWGHEGTAIGACQTYSIGFRAPGGVELSTAFLDFLHERGFAEAAYRDPGRRPAAHPATIDAHLVDHADSVLGRIRWNRRDVREFLGRCLSEPKQHVFFDPPTSPVQRREFLRRLRSATVRLDPRTRMLVQGDRLYVNGTGHPSPKSARASLMSLADRREIAGSRVSSAASAGMLYEWYLLGFLSLQESPR